MHQIARFLELQICQPASCTVPQICTDMVEPARRLNHPTDTYAHDCVEKLHAPVIEGVSVVAEAGNNSHASDHHTLLRILLCSSQNCKPAADATTFALERSVMWDRGQRASQGAARLGRKRTLPCTLPMPLQRQLSRCSARNLRHCVHLSLSSPSSAPVLQHCCVGVPPKRTIPMLPVNIGLASLPVAPLISRRTAYMFPPGIV